MKIQVISTAQQGKDFDYNGKIAVVIDVLRATSVITTALDHGARSVVAVKTVEEAEQIYTSYREGTALRGGERNAVKITGFDLGNSPLEYKSEVVSGKDIILTTTNGTNAINNVGRAEMVLLACFRNMSAVANCLLHRDKDLVIVCSGTEGRFSLDDGLCAGMLINMLRAKSETDCDDLAILLERDYTAHAHNLFGSLVECAHFRRLFTLGFYDDLRFCLQTNCVQTIPIVENGHIVVLKK